MGANQDADGRLAAWRSLAWRHRSLSCRVGGSRVTPCSSPWSTCSTVALRHCNRVSGALDRTEGVVMAVHTVPHGRRMHKPRRTRHWSRDARPLQLEHRTGLLEVPPESSPQADRGRPADSAFFSSSVSGKWRERYQGRRMRSTLISWRGFDKEGFVCCALLDKLDGVGRTGRLVEAARRSLSRTAQRCTVTRHS